MCSVCKHSCKNLTIPHTPLDCQWRRTLYCYICCSYGHSPPICPDQEAIALRSGKLPTQPNLYWRVKQDPESMKEEIIKNGLKPSSKQDMNKQILRDLSNTQIPLRILLFY
uniref:Nanos-type domain-containing protein n=1 Tax=viral metagenome TaxID=1070528 RepID=A0A6C0DPF6_9ZZZZ